MKNLRSTRAGFTLLEVSISVGLLGLVFGLAAMVSDTSKSAFVATSSQTQLEARLKTALNRVAIEIETASTASLDPQLTGMIADTDSLNMQLVVAIDIFGEPVLGDVTTVGYQQDPRDAEDGADNDGDGLIDEGALVLIRDAGGADQITTTLCRDVRRFLEGEDAALGDENGNGLNNESGFLVTRDGNLLTIQLTIEEALANGEITTRTSSTSVMLRN